MTKHKLLALAAALGLAATLSACGGGDDDLFGGDDNGGPVAGNPGGNGDPDGGDPETGIPTSALQSSSALVAYVQNLIASNVNIAEPIPIGDGVNLPKDDRSEAIALR